MKPIITIAVQCHNFQRRFCWMLSSLAQQTKPGYFTLDVAHVTGNGKPTTEACCALFEKRIDIRRTEWESIDSFQYRGFVRNRQIQECQTEWLLFGDCDMVYHPQYFEKLCTELERNFRKASHMVSSGRMSNPKDQTNALVNSRVLLEASEVTLAWETADGLPKRKMRNIGAGFCQIINAIHAPHGGYYVDPGNNRDWGFDRGWNTKSDMHFRKRISAGGPRKSLPRWFTWNAIHLNHNRDPEAKKHLEEQR